MNSFLRWVGGKSGLCDRIVSLIPDHTCYVETCCGGAWVFFRKDRESSRSEVLNDIDGDLVNLYQVLQRQGRKLLREVDCLPYSRAVFLRLFDSEPRSPMARAVRYLYVNRVSFGGKMVDRSFGVKVTGRVNVLQNWLRDDPDVLVDRLRGVILESMDLVDLVDRYDRPQTFFFVDPPYYGLSQPYAGQFKDIDHARVAARLKNLKGKVLISYNDCPEVRALYRGLTLREVTTRYSIERNETSQAKELFITNF
ncbi:MAG: DNA adenine methylase [Planctomycetaceae bacterium]|nr:DNA adenine methylase [Planctomycetaceae bacterium]